MDLPSYRRSAEAFVSELMRAYYGHYAGLDAELARREAGLSISLDGERIGYRESNVVQANEPDAQRRAEIEAQRLRATEERLNPLYETGSASTSCGARIWRASSARPTTMSCSRRTGSSRACSRRCEASGSASRTTSYWTSSRARTSRREHSARRSGCPPRSTW